MGTGTATSVWPANLCHILLPQFALLLHLPQIGADHAQALEGAAPARREAAVPKAAEEEQAAC